LEDDVVAVEEIEGVAAHIVAERREVEALRLRLTGADHAACVLDSAVQRLLRKEHHRRFDDGEDDREEGQSEKAELDRCHTTVVARKLTPAPNGGSEQASQQ